MEYNEFLKRKKHSVIDTGFEVKYLPDLLFDFQKYIVEYTASKGRSAMFIDTGLGKTAMELTLAYNAVQNTNKRVLILTPLAVAYQFEKDSEKFQINDVYHSKDGSFHNNKIIVANYERLHYFDSNDFDTIILDESSILKNFDGKIKSNVTNFMKKLKYRFLATATPSPNDYIELGTSSEALGYLGYMDMLKMFFGNNENNIRPQEIANKWYLKPHAINDFFNWVSGWSISARKPSDLGFDNKDFELPNLNVNYNVVKNPNNQTINNQILLFNKVSQTMTEVKDEQKDTIEYRVQKAMELANDKTSVYWVNFNAEGDLLDKLDKDAVQIKGGMNIDKKEEILIAFSNNEIKRLITKPKMTAFGLNWQHCNHTVYFPTWSYEQYYQSIRRFWRFGQKRDVTVDMVYTDGQKRVIDTLLLKTKKADELFTLLNSYLHKTYKPNIKEIDNNIILPKFLGV